MILARIHLTRLNLIMAFEDAFDIEIPDEDAEKLERSKMPWIILKEKALIVGKGTVMSKRVVVTGLGVVSPVGNDVHTFWESLCAGKSGISRITSLTRPIFRRKSPAKSRSLIFPALSIAKKSTGQTVLSFLRFLPQTWPSKIQRPESRVLKTLLVSAQSSVQGSAGSKLWKPSMPNFFHAARRAFLRF